MIFLKKLKCFIYKISLFLVAFFSVVVPFSNSLNNYSLVNESVSLNKSAHNKMLSSSTSNLLSNGYYFNSFNSIDMVSVGFCFEIISSDFVSFSNSLSLYFGSSSSNLMPFGLLYSSESYYSSIFDSYYSSLVNFQDSNNFYLRTPVFNGDSVFYLNIKSSVASLASSSSIFLCFFYDCGNVQVSDSLLEYYQFNNSSRGFYAFDRANWLSSSNRIRFRMFYLSSSSVVSDLISLQSQYDSLLVNYNDLLNTLNTTCNIFDSTLVNSVDVEYYFNGSVDTVSFNSLLLSMWRDVLFNSSSFDSNFIAYRVWVSKNVLTSSYSSDTNYYVFGDNSYISKITINYDSSNDVFIDNSCMIRFNTYPQSTNGLLYISYNDSSSPLGFLITEVDLGTSDIKSIGGVYSSYTFNRAYHNINSISLRPNSKVCSVVDLGYITSGYDYGFRAGVASLQTQIQSLNDSLTLYQNYYDEFQLYKNDYNQAKLDEAFSKGQASVSSDTSNMTGLFTAIASVPITILNGLSGFAIWGTPILSVMITLLFLALLLWLIKMFI